MCSTGQVTFYKVPETHGQPCTFQKVTIVYATLQYWTSPVLQGTRPQCHVKPVTLYLDEMLFGVEGTEAAKGIDMEDPRPRFVQLAASSSGGDGGLKQKNYF